MKEQQWQSSDQTDRENGMENIFCLSESDCKDKQEHSKKYQPLPKIDINIIEPSQKFTYGSLVHRDINRISESSSSKDFSFFSEHLYAAILIDIVCRTIPVLETVISISREMSDMKEGYDQEKYSGYSSYPSEYLFYLGKTKK
ncbi:TPA: hypothetical protein DCZ39_03780 [Patescibacteria group bacterium]|nr:hypothetical protein [Candidatus Gracilibacteria bacterium]